MGRLVNSPLLILTLAGITYESSGLIKNCVTPSEWDSDMSNTPRCEVVSDASYVTCYGQGQVSIDRQGPQDQKSGEFPTIVCNASYLLDVDVTGFKIKGQPLIFFFRHVEVQTKKPRVGLSSSQTIHSIVIPLIGSVWSPRDIIIRGYDFPDLKTGFYVYYPGPNDRALPFDWPNEKNIPTIIEPEGQWATLPCQVTHYTDSVGLTKVGPEGGDIALEVNNSTIRFEPRSGFILDTYGTTMPWGVYTCQAMNPRKSKSDIETLQVRLRKLKDFTVEPNEAKLDLFDGSDLSVTCSSSSPVEMQGTLNGALIPSANFTYSRNATYRLEYSVEYFYEDVVHSQIASITCKNEAGKSHSWKVTTWDLENNKLLEIRNNGSFISCKSNVSDYVTLFNAECMNYAHCRSRKQAIDTFGAGQCDLALKFVECGQPCNLKQKRGGKCFSADKAKRSGVFRCETDTLTHSVTYIIGYDGLIYLTSKFDQIPREALARIVVPKEVLYTNVPNTFKCEASSFVSNGDFTWLLRSKNGTTYLPNIVQTQATHDYFKIEDSVWEADMIFKVVIKELEVICFIPIWNSQSEWINVSVFINVSVPEVPDIDPSDKEVRYFLGDKNRNLPCKASGEPKPKIEWYKNGKVVNNTDTDADGKILEFSIIRKDMEGIYTCVATNIAGIDSEDFHIKVEEPPNITLYIVIGVILLVLLTITLLVLYWKLLKAKNEIRNLSDEEVNEFLNGNPEAAKSAKEPHEIIMYLPFNPEFEIQRDKLIFDEHDILGSGAFGVVIRGKLTGHHEEVAIKTLKPFSAISYFKALLSELKIMVYIGKHENVVTLIGAYTGKIKERVLYMVVELSPFGNLEDYLRNNQKNFQNQVRNDKICIPRNAMLQQYTNFDQTAQNAMYMNTFYTTDLLNMSYQIAEGMNHLASKKVIHADLATRNVLLYKDGVVKITDFGLSRQLYAYTSYMKKEQEPLPWRSMAIESLREMNFSTQSDVWAYGVTLWELFSLGAVPYPGLSWSIDFVDKLVQGLRLSKPNFATTEIYEVLIQCWHSEPDQRPSFDDLRNIFLNMKISVEKLCEHEN